MQKRKKKPFDSYFIPHDHFICPSPWSSKHGSSVCGSPPPPPLSLHTPFPSPNITQFEGNNSWRL